MYTVTQNLYPNYKYIHLYIQRITYEVTNCSIKRRCSQSRSMYTNTEHIVLKRSADSSSETLSHLLALDPHSMHVSDTGAQGLLSSIGAEGDAASLN